MKTKAKPVSENFFLKYANAFFILAVIIVYGKVFSLSGLTHLDDTIFIFDKQEFNKHFSNLLRTFSIGCFNEKDIYYRPLFLATFVLEYPFTRHSFTLYHFVSIALHCVNVILLFALLKRINIAARTAFVLSLIYAVHPVLTMAVAWIPGYNDLLLTAFTFSFFLSAINYAENQKPLAFIRQLIFYLLCLFTKETAVFIPFVAVLLFYFWKKENLFQKKYFLLATSWAAALALWYFMRSRAMSDYSQGIFNSSLLDNFQHRLPGLLQYLGKIILPFNLSVFPTIENTSYLFGIIALGILCTIVFLNKERDNKMVLFGAGWFLFFILPFFFVPKNINDQLFEHRLYLPIVGIFIILSQSVLFSKRISEKTVLKAGGIVAVLFAIMTISYIGKFDDQLSFWQNAVNDSPGSSYANKMYGIKLTEKKRNDEAIPYIKSAYAIDSTERYVNLFLARLVYLPADSLDKAERCLKTEIKINPQFADTYFELAHLYFMKNDLEKAKEPLIKFISFRPKEEMANNNLLRLYYDTKHFEDAEQQMKTMDERGIPYDAKIKELVEAQLKK